MPPTINNTTTNGTADKRPPQRPTERRSELICRIKYGNTLPDIPFDLKFLQYPFDSHRFVQYNPTSLERNYKYEVLTEHDLGVTIDLINRDLYQSDGHGHLDPADEKLLEEDVHAHNDSVRSRQHSRSVSWLRKSEYISTEQTRFQPQNLENIEAKVGYNVKKSLREETLYLDRDAQIKAIEKTFADSKTDINKHYSKPNVVPVEVLPIYPDFLNWKYPCAQVIFDSDPAPIGKNVPAQIEEMSQAMIRGVMDESGEQFVAYFLPTETTLEKRRNDFTENVLYKDEEEYEYKIAREYNWNVKSKATKGYEENYFFVLRPDGVYYNELETRVRLNKRRVKAGQQPANTKLVVKHRPLDANEHRMQRYRERQLEPAGDEDDEEEMDDYEEDDDEVEQTQTTQTEKAAEKPKADEAEATPKAAQNAKDADEQTRERQARSRTRSQSKSRSRTRSRSGSARSGTRSPSRSRSRSRSASGGSASPRRSHSKSASRSPAGSRAASQSPAGSRAGSQSPAGSHAGSQSPAGSRPTSRSRSRSRSRSASGTRSGTHSRSASRSKSRSVSHSPSRSKSRSQSRNPSRSPSKTGSRSPSPAGSQHSGSASRSASRSKSRSYSPPGSRSRSGSASGSRSGSASRSRSGTPSGSGSGSGSEED